MLKSATENTPDMENVPEKFPIGKMFKKIFRIWKVLECGTENIPDMENLEFCIRKYSRYGKCSGKYSRRRKC